MSLNRINKERHYFKVSLKRYHDPVERYFYDML